MKDMNNALFLLKDRWTASLPDGRGVTYSYGRMLCGLGSARAWVEGSKIMHVRNNLQPSLGRHQIEALFQSELTEEAGRHPAPRLVTCAQA
jgi:hypothetical protein